MKDKPKKSLVHVSRQLANEYRTGNSMLVIDILGGYTNETSPHPEWHLHPAEYAAVTALVLAELNRNEQKSLTSALWALALNI